MDHLRALKDVLSHLTSRAAVKLLGAEGAQLLRKGGQFGLDIEEQVILTKDVFTLFAGGSTVTIALEAPAASRSECGAAPAGRPAGVGTGGFLLLVSGFQEEHPGHVQAHSACPRRIWEEGQRGGAGDAL
jgi:hypothetical protein